MTFSSKALLGLVIAAVLVIGAFAGYRWLKGRQVAVHLKAADQLDVQQAAAGTQAVTHEQAAAAIAPVLRSDDSRVAQDRTALAKLQHPAYVPAPGSHDPAPHSGPVPPTVDLAAMDAVKDRLITDLTKQVTDLKAANAELTAADQARQAQVTDLQAENKQLRAAIAAEPKPLKWATGAVYGTTNLGDTSRGVFVDRDLSVLRTGVEIVKNTYAAANRQAWEVRVHLGIRF